MKIQINIFPNRSNSNIFHNILKEIRRKFMIELCVYCDFYFHPLLVSHSVATELRVRSRTKLATSAL